MARYGLRIKSPVSGAVLLEVTDRITRTLGVFTTGRAAGSFTVPNVGKAWFALMDAGEYFGSDSPPGMNQVGNTLTWKVSNQSLMVIYGVY